MKYYSLPHLVKQIAFCQSRPSDSLTISQKAQSVRAELPKDPQVQMVQQDFNVNRNLLLNIASFC